jgi:hypothetical protein
MERANERTKQASKQLIYCQRMQPYVLVSAFRLIAPGKLEWSE